MKQRTTKQQVINYLQNHRRTIRCLYNNGYIGLIELNMRLSTIDNCIDEIKGETTNETKIH